MKLGMKKDYVEESEKGGREGGRGERNIIILCVTACMTMCGCTRSNKLFSKAL